MSRRFFPAILWLVLAILLVAGASFACGAPLPRSFRESEALEETEERSRARELSLGPEPVPAILEARRLTLEWPPAIRAGDSDVVRLTFELDEGGDLQATAEFEGHETRSEKVEIPDLYDTHLVFAEARMEMAGLEVAPNDLASQPLMRGRPVSFYWSIHPKEVGTYRGAVWFYLRYVPKDDGQPIQHPVTVQPLEIRTVDLFGLSGAPARLLGGLGTIIGSILGLDSILPWVWKIFRKREK